MFCETIVCVERQKKSGQKGQATYRTFVCISQALDMPSLNNDPRTFEFFANERQQAMFQPAISLFREKTNVSQGIFQYLPCVSQCVFLKPSQSQSFPEIYCLVMTLNISSIKVMLLLIFFSLWTLAHSAHLIVKRNSCTISGSYHDLTGYCSGPFNGCHKDQMGISEVCNCKDPFKSLNYIAHTDARTITCSLLWYQIRLLR